MRRTTKPNSRLVLPLVQATSKLFIRKLLIRLIVLNSFTFPTVSADLSKWSSCFLLYLQNVHTVQHEWLNDTLHVGSSDD
jgi:hypothetical protein